MIRYTAKRSLAPGHTLNGVYDLDVEVMDAIPDVRDVKQVERSAGGAMETTFERQDVYWTISLAPVRGEALQRLIEWIDSIESGETFRVWLRDSDVSPLVLKMDGDPASLDAFLRAGGESTDYFSAQVTALQAAPYAIAGLESGGFAGGDSEPVDIYDPEEGGPGGGLEEGEPPDMIPPDQFVVLFTAASFDTGAGVDTSPDNLPAPPAVTQGSITQSNDFTFLARLFTWTGVSGDGQQFQIYYTEPRVSWWDTLEIWEGDQRAAIAAGTQPPPTITGSLNSWSPFDEAVPDTGMTKRYWELNASEGVLSQLAPGQVYTMRALSYG